MSAPQGLSTSPGWFQSVMTRVCDNLERVRPFVDDIIVFSCDGAEHTCQGFGKVFRAHGLV